MLERAKNKVCLLTSVLTSVLSGYQCFTPPIAQYLYNQHLENLIWVLILQLSPPTSHFTQFPLPTTTYPVCIYKPVAHKVYYRFLMKYIITHKNSCWRKLLHLNMSHDSVCFVFITHTRMSVHGHCFPNLVLLLHSCFLRASGTK